MAARTTASWVNTMATRPSARSATSSSSAACDAGVQVGQGFSPLDLEGVGLRPPSLPMLRPLLGNLVLGIALPMPDPQLPEAVVDDRLTAEPRREGCRRLHGTGEGARNEPVDRLLSKDIGDRGGGPHPSRLDALIEPTHRTALAVRGRAAVADQVDAGHSSMLSVARACCSASPNGSRSRRLGSTNSPSKHLVDRTQPAIPPADNARRVGDHVLLARLLIDNLTAATTRTGGKPARP